MSNFEETFQPLLFKHAVTASSCFTPEMGILDLEIPEGFIKKPDSHPEIHPCTTVVQNGTPNIFMENESHK